MLAHYKIDPKRNRLLLLSCNAEDMLLPRSNFTFYGTRTTTSLLLYLLADYYHVTLPENI